MFSNQRIGEWLKLCADLETAEAMTPAQRPLPIIPSSESAKAIDLSGIWRMSAEEVEQALAAEQCS